MIVAFLMRLGLSQRLAGVAVWVIAAALLLLAIWWMRTSAYSAGVSDTDAKWKAASEEVEKQAEVATARADSAAEVRAVEHVQQVEKEKEKIDEAIREGSSPLDVLFGGNGM